MTKRWKIPDKPPDRPKVPEVIQKLREYRRLPGRYCGGVVHAIVDDPNYEQTVADSCLAAAPTFFSDKYADKDVEIASLLAQMTKTQRKKVAAPNTYPELDELIDG